MFKKGFLVKASSKPSPSTMQEPSQTQISKKEESSSLTSESVQRDESAVQGSHDVAVEEASGLLSDGCKLSASYGGLPVELIIYIVEKLVKVHGCDEEQLPRNIASLRLTSKLLCKVATPHFYNVIKINNPAGVVPLVTSLQHQPELCATTRAIWWGAMQDCSVSKPLVRFPNVDEVAYCWRLRLSGTQTEVAVGEHYAMRDKGPWCEAAMGFRAFDMAGWMQCTPTLSMIQEHDFSCSRAIWAVHLVISTIKGMLKRIPRSVTHVTLSFLDHPQVESMELDSALVTLLDVRQYPILRRLEINIVYTGKPKGGVPTAEDLALRPDLPKDAQAYKLYELRSWAQRWSQIRHALAIFNDARVTCQSVGSPESELGTHARLDTRFEDISEYTKMGWRHRIYFRRGMIWRGAPMTWPSTDF